MNTESINRRQARIIALQVNYQHLLLEKDVKPILASLSDTNQVDGYLYALTIGMQEHINDYKRIVSAYLKKGWSLDRMPYVQQALLLMACHEILSMGTAKTVAINEAIELAKLYGDEDDFKTINAILDRV